MIALYGLSEGRLYDYVTPLRAASEIVRTGLLLITPIRDVNDTIVMQTGIIGDADVLSTKDNDFFEPPAQPFLQ